MDKRSACITIVEDERIIALDIQNCLVQEGYATPSVYSSGEAAITAAEERKPDLLLMDVMLKGKLDGFTAARKIRELHDTPIIFITALMDEKTKAAAAMISPSGMIGKPINIKQLMEVVEKALNPGC